MVVADDASPAPGEYVALTVDGAGDWSPELAWDPAASAGPTLLNPDVDAAARVVGVRWAYTRSDGAAGSVTVFLPRLGSGDT